MYSIPTISTEELVQYRSFYQRHGIRAVSQLMTLRDNKLEEFNIPVNTTIHFTIRDTGDIGILEDDELLTNAGARVLVDYVPFYIGTIIGRPTRKSIQAKKIITQFVNRSKRFKYLPYNGSLFKNTNVPYVISYGMIDENYKYTTTDGVDYFRRRNYFNTVLMKVAEELRSSDRNQFIYVDIPSVLPNLSRLEQAETELYRNIDSKPVPIDNRLRKVFGSDATYFLLELWLWAGANRKLSIFAALDDRDLDRVNFLTSLDGRYSVLNLGQFNTWIKTDQNPEGNLKPIQAQRAILRHYMALQQIRSVSDDTVLVDEESQQDRAETANPLDRQFDEAHLKEALAEDSEYATGQVADATSDVNIDTSKIRARSERTLEIKSKQKVDPISQNDFADMGDDEQFLMDQMDRDLRQLETTGAQNDVDDITNSENVYTEYKPRPDTLEHDISSVAQDLQSKGLLSAAEVRRANALAEKYKTIKSPFDPKQTLETYKNISTESLKIPPVVKLTEKKLNGLTDPSVLHSSMKDFTSRYLNEVMGKDVVNALLHVQKAGVAVTDLKVEEHHDILGSKQTLSVQLTPVYGKPQTVKIAIPIFDQDGKFKANKVTYKLKAQRVDKMCVHVKPI